MLFFVTNPVVCLEPGYVCSARIVHDLETSKLFFFDDRDCYLMFIVNSAEFFMDSKAEMMLLLMRYFKMLVS